MGRKLLPIMLLCFALIFDRATKTIARLSPRDFYFGDSHIVFGIRWNYSLLPIDNRLIFWSSIVVFVFLLIIAINSVIQRQHKPMVYALALLLTGAASNIFDRIRYGAVIDVFSVPFGTANIADGLIIVGVMWLLFFPSTISRISTDSRDGRQ